MMKTLYFLYKDGMTNDFTTSLRTAKDMARKKDCRLIIEAELSVDIESHIFNYKNVYVYCRYIDIFETQPYNEFLQSLDYKYIFRKE